MTYNIKSKCMYYGEPCGCNHPDGPQRCCDDLEEIAMAKIRMDNLDETLICELTVGQEDLCK